MCTLLPGDPPALQRPHDLLRALRRAEKVGIIDRDHARAAVVNFPDHLRDRPVAELEPVHQRFGAERAALVAATRGLHEGAVDVTVLLEQVVPRHRQAFHRVQPVGPVGTAHRAPLEIVEELVEHELRLPDHHRVAMLERLLRHEAGVHAAHHDRHSARPERIGDLVPAVHVARHRRQANQIRLQVEVDRLDVLVGEHDLVTVPWDAGRDGQQARERRIEGPVQV